MYLNKNMVIAVEFLTFITRHRFENEIFRQIHLTQPNIAQATYIQIM